MVDTARAHSGTVPVHATGPAARQAPGDMADTVPLVPPGLLAGASRILFVTHLAIGDFTYMQACLRAFARAHPHVRIHLWVDERRRTNNAAHRCSKACGRIRRRCCAFRGQVPH